MKKVLFTSVALIGLATAAPASANEIVQQLLNGGLAAAAGVANDVYLNGQITSNVSQAAKAAPNLGELKAGWDANEGKTVYGSVTAANIGNSLSIEDTSPAPVITTTVEKGTEVINFEGAISGGEIVNGKSHTNGLDISGVADTKGLDVKAGHWKIGEVNSDARVDGTVTKDAMVTGEVSGKVTGSITVPTYTVVDVKEFAKGDVYLNGQVFKNSSQYAELSSVACVTCTGGTSSLENVSQTAANIGNSVSITDLGTKYRGENGDLYTTVQYTADVSQTAKAIPTVGKMTGGAITAANIGNSISITDKLP